jgi:hypothetical protein
MVVPFKWNLTISGFIFSSGYNCFFICQMELAFIIILVCVNNYSHASFHLFIIVFYLPDGTRIYNHSRVCKNSFSCFVSYKKTEGLILNSFLYPFPPSTPLLYKTLLIQLCISELLFCKRHHYISPKYPCST